MDAYLPRFYGAIQASVKDEEGSPKHLLKNLMKCYKTVKKTCASDEKFEELKKMTTKILLLCCPTVAFSSAVTSNKDFLPIIKNLPSINSEICFNTICDLKQLDHLEYILPEFGLIVNIKLLEEVFNQHLLEQQQLYIIFEIVKSIFKCIEEPEDHEEVFNSITQWSSLLQREKWETSPLEPFGAKLEYILSSIQMIHQKVGAVFINKNMLNNSSGIQESQLMILSKYKDRYMKILSTFVEVLENALKKISSLIWIELDSLPSTCLKNNDISAQTHIGHLAFSVKKILSQYELSHFKTLLEVLAHLSIDPEHDEEEDLVTEELVVVLKKHGITSKLLCILAQRSDIFLSDDACDLLNSFNDYLSADSSHRLISNIITFLDSKETSKHSNWKEVALKYAKTLPLNVIEEILKEDLDFGTKQVLLTEKFSHEFTATLNKLVSAKVHNLDDAPYLLACLQSSSHTIKYTVEDSLKMQGLAPLTANSLRHINYLCLEPDENGISKLVNSMEAASSTIGYDEEMLLDVFIEEILKTNIDCGYDYERTAGRRTYVSFVSELVHVFIIPPLNSNCSNYNKLMTSMKILESLVTYKMIDLLATGSVLNILLEMLLLNYHNVCAAISKGKTYSSKLQTSFENVSTTILKAMKDRKLSTNIENLGKQLQQYDLHPYCFNLLNDILPCEGISTYVDEILQYLISSDPELGRKIKDYSKEKPRWVFGLSVVLPYCSEDQWVASMKVTHISGTFKEHGQKISRILDVFKQVLMLLMKDKSYHSNPSNFNAVFRKFAAASIIFFEEEVSTFKLAKKIDGLLLVTAWWCTQMVQWKYHGDLITSLLNKFVQLLKDYFSKQQSCNKLLNDDCGNSESLKLSTKQMNFLTQILIPNFTHFVPESSLKSAVARDIESFVTV